MKMLNFCIFVFIAYFFKGVFRMVFPEKTVIHKGVLVAQYAGERQRKIKKAPRKNSVVLYENNRNKIGNSEICA